MSFSALQNAAEAVSKTGFIYTDIRSNDYGYSLTVWDAEPANCPIDDSVSHTYPKGEIIVAGSGDSLTEAAIHALASLISRGGDSNATTTDIVPGVGTHIEGPANAERS